MPVNRVDSPSAPPTISLEKVRQLIDRHNSQQWQIAETLQLIKARRHYRRWGYKSFQEFVDKEVRFGQRKLQMMMRVDHIFRQKLELTRSQREEMSIHAANLIASQVNSKNLEEMIELAKSLSLRELKARLRPARSGSTSSGSRAVPATVTRSEPRPMWRRPRPRDFFVQEKHWESLCHAVFSGQPTLVLGPSGSGKTELCERVSRATGRQLYRFNFGDMSEPRSSLLGSLQFTKEKGTFFSRSRFVTAIEKGNCVILMDEFNRAGPDAWNILLPLLDGQGYLALDESEDAKIIKRATKVIFLATANVGIEYTGTNDLDQANLDRFVSVITIDFPPIDEEIRLIQARCGGVNREDVHLLVQLANQQRELARDGDYQRQISTRSLLGAATQLANGISLENAYQHCIVNRFCGQGGNASEQAKLIQLFKKFKPGS